MGEKPQEKPEPPQKRKIEIDLRDLFEPKQDPKGGSSSPKPEPPAEPDDATKR